MTINQVALSNTFNEFRTTFNDAANVVNSLQGGTGNSNVNFLTVSGGVSSNLIPSTNVTYDLGTSSNRWNDLYLSGTTVYLGDAELKVQSGQFKVVIGSDEVFTASNTGQSVSNTIVANNVTINENLTVTGNLTVEGTQTILNVNTLNIEDKNILVANGAANPAAANGAGLTVDGAQASIIYNNTGDKFQVNKNIDLGANTLGANSITVAGVPTLANQVSNKAYTDATAILYAIVL